MESSCSNNFDLEKKNKINNSYNELKARCKLAYSMHKKTQLVTVWSFKSCFDSHP